MPVVVIVKFLIATFWKIGEDLPKRRQPTHHATCAHNIVADLRWRVSAIVRWNTDKTSVNVSRPGIGGRIDDSYISCGLGGGCGPQDRANVVWLSQQAHYWRWMQAETGIIINIRPTLKCEWTWKVDNKFAYNCNVIIQELKIDHTATTHD